jgi:hypothetical protein
MHIRTLFLLKSIKKYVKKKSLFNNKEKKKKITFASESLFEK